LGGPIKGSAGKLLGLDEASDWLLPTSAGASSKYRDLEQQLSRPQSAVKFRNCFVCDIVAAISPVRIPVRCITKLDPGNSNSIKIRTANGAYFVLTGIRPHTRVVDSLDVGLPTPPAPHRPPPHASNVIKENRTPLNPITHVAGTHDVTITSTSRKSKLLKKANAAASPMRLDDPMPNSRGVAMEAHVSMLNTQCKSP
jgi:hypothetical protein